MITLRVFVFSFTNSTNISSKKPRFFGCFSYTIINDFCFHAIYFFLCMRFTQNSLCFFRMFSAPRGISDFPSGFF